MVDTTGAEFTVDQRARCGWLRERLGNLEGQQMIRSLIRKRLIVFVIPVLCVACRMAEKGSVRELACEIDCLERHIDTFGSVVVKQPDVWGQARLTKHREEYEQQMAAELGNFHFLLNGSVAGSDQAYLADAFALSAAAGGGSTDASSSSKGKGGASSSNTTNVIVPASGSGTGSTTTPPATGTGSTTPAAGTSSDGSGNAGSGSGTPAAGNGSAASDPSGSKSGTDDGSGAKKGSGSSPTPLALPALPDQKSAFAAFQDNNLTRTPVRMPPQSQQQLTFAGASSGIALEPPLRLDQKSQYLNHLHELRRINEGDDTADAPGYALNIVRVPISVLPGKRTDCGYGAEVTLTLRPYLSEELLPTTFRNLVVNDLIDQLAYPITQFINDPDNAVFLDPLAADDLRDLFHWLDRAAGYLAASRAPEGRGGDRPINKYFEELKKLRWSPSLQPLFERADWKWLDAALREAEPIGTDGKLTFPEMVLKWMRHRFLNNSIVAQSKSRRAQMPFPPNQIPAIYGSEGFFLLAKDAYNALARQPFSQQEADVHRLYIHLPDVQGYLGEKLAGAYELLKLKEKASCWDACSSQQRLAAAIRKADADAVYVQRTAYADLIAADSAETLRPLAWGILVEAALLNEKLREDIHEATRLKGSVVVSAEGVEFFRPEPTTDARQIFNQYVQSRWPIHVFALDPAAQEQNLQSTFSVRREMQLAMSLAFVNGKVSAQNMMQYARRLEFDYATIDLNGTAIGFSHGDETFGWRFYPRFQVPDVESNATVIFRDLLVGGPNKDALLRQRRLEPGIRECYAVVIMPSFVPYATLNVSTSWFSLTNPREKQLDTTAAMELSQRVRFLQDRALCVNDGECYRSADLYHLTEKVRQLETRLPLQSTQVQIPYENTLGGFAMFNVGITELAPELVGWYGTSAINPKTGGTLFLVGDHFSVHQTAVIAGGQPVAYQSMLSRQVMEIVIPPNPMLVSDKNGKFVDVQLATPYGVTQHLLIPAVIPTDPLAGVPPSILPAALLIPTPVPPPPADDVNPSAAAPAADTSKADTSKTDTSKADTSKGDASQGDASSGNKTEPSSGGASKTGAAGKKKSAS